MIPRFKKSRYEPRPIETDYWIDLNENEYGGVFKYYDDNAMVWKLTESITKEKEPQFTNSPAFKITTNDINYWNNKVGIEDFDALKEEILDLGSQFEGVTVETLEYYMDILRSDFNNETDKIQSELDNKADKSTTIKGYGIKDAYTKTEIDTKFTEWKVDLPENVSYFKNDVGYVTESNLEEKLPDNIVSDANYVHTDNNYTTAEKNKLASLNNYDDTEIKKLVQSNLDRINSLSEQVEEDITTIVNTLSEEIAKKANIDEVYTRTYLDEIFTQFVRKTHKTYGFVDERPTADMTVEDTGFVFYDYTVNESLLWVSDEWRLLRTNEVFEGFLLSKDINMVDRLNWEYEDITDEYCRLTKYIGTYSSSMILNVPNMRTSSKFVLHLGESLYDKIGEPKTFVIQTATSHYNYSHNSTRYAVTTTHSHKFSTVGYGWDIADLIDNNNLAQLVFTDVFGRIVANGKTEYLTVPSYTSTPVTLPSMTNTVIDAINISQGIKNINAFAFTNITPYGTLTDVETETTDEDGNTVTIVEQKSIAPYKIDIPSGIEFIGEYSFYNTGVTEITFPRNPIKLGNQCFRSNPLKKIVFPKTLDWEYIKNGGGCYCFAKGTNSEKAEVILKDGVEAIPFCAFNDTLVQHIDFPDSLNFVGYAAFVGSKMDGSFYAKNLKTIESWAFGECAFTKVDLSGVEILGPYAFANSYANCSLLIFGPTIKRIGAGALPKSGYCANNIVIPESITELSGGCLSGYAANVGGYDNSVLKIELDLGKIKVIGYLALYNSKFNDILTLPDELECIATYGLGKTYCLKNETIKIGKNVRYIGTSNNHYGGDVTEAEINDPVVLARKHPYSPNGYPLLELEDYLKDGGKLDERGYSAFYQFAPKHFKNFEVDPENKWFKEIDGVLFSADGKRLVLYPQQHGLETYEVPEGCEYFDAVIFANTGLKRLFTSEAPDGTVTEYNIFSGTEYDVHTADIALRTVILPNTFINYTPEEILEKFPLTSWGDTANMLHQAQYFYSGIERFLVKEDNPKYKNDGDWLLSKDGTVLQIFPIGMKGTHRIPDSVTTIANGAISTPHCVYVNGAWRAVSLVYNADVEDFVITNTNYAATSAAYVLWYTGLHIIIPPSVVNITKCCLDAFNAINRLEGSSVTLEDGNPAFTFNISTGNIERIS